MVTVGIVALLVVALLVVTGLVIPLLVVAGLAGLGSGLARLYALAVGSGLAGLGSGLTRLPPLAVSPGLPRTHPRLTRLYALTIGSRLAGTHRLAPGLTGLYSLAIGSRLVRPHPLAITARLAGTGSRSIGSGLSTRSSLSVSGIAAGLSARSALTFCALSAGLSVKWSRLRPRTKVPGLSARHSALSAFYRFRLGILRFPAINPIPARRTALTGRRLHSTPRRFGLLRLRSALSVRFFPIRRSFPVPGRLALIQTVCLQNRRNIGHNRRYPGLL